MKSITIQKNDSPKFYFYFKDIYGEPLNLDSGDLVDLKYSISEIVAGQKIPLEGYTNIETSMEWNSAPANYPTAIKGLSAAQKELGYHLAIFPYFRASNDGGEWQSPFTKSGATYQLDVEIAYYMDDPTLDSAAVYRRVYSVKIITGA